MFEIVEVNNVQVEPRLDTSDPRLSDVSPTDQAELLLSGVLLRYRGWNGSQFMHVETIADACYSLANSILYRRIFDNNGVRFYRRDKAIGTV